MYKNNYTLHHLPRVIIIILLTRNQRVIITIDNYEYLNMILKLACFGSTHIRIANRYAKVIAIHTCVTKQ